MLGRVQTSEFGSQYWDIFPEGNTPLGPGALPQSKHELQNVNLEQKVQDIQAFVIQLFTDSFKA